MVVVEDIAKIILVLAIIAVTIWGIFTFFNAVKSNPLFQVAPEEKIYGPAVHVTSEADDISDGTLLLPVSLSKTGRFTIASSFGNRSLRDPQASKCHAGIDIHANLKDPVFAAADGIVVSITDNILEGENRNIVLKHQIGNKVFYTRYVHVHGETRLLNKPVKAGDRIATIGPHRNGPHLHFEVLHYVPADQMTSEMYCTTEQEKQQKSIVVFTHPKMIVEKLGKDIESILGRKDYSSLNTKETKVDKWSPHLNPYCFFPKATQKLADYYGNKENLVKGCATYQKWAIKI